MVVLVAVGTKLGLGSRGVAAKTYTSIVHYVPVHFGCDSFYIEIRQSPRGVLLYVLCASCSVQETARGRDDGGGVVSTCVF